MATPIVSGTQLFACTGIGANVITRGRAGARIVSIDLRSNIAADERISWEFTTEIGAQFLVSPVLKDGVLLALDTNGMLHAIDSGDGSILWNERIGTEPDLFASLVDVGDTIAIPRAE